MNCLHCVSTIIKEQMVVSVNVRLFLRQIAGNQRETKESIIIA
jgi:hypothetical protein